MVIEKIKYGRGRPKRGEIRPGKKPVKETVGRPIGRVQKAPGASFSLGKSYIDLLSTISDDLQETRSAIIRQCINRLARRFNLPQATFEVDEAPWRPSEPAEGDDTYLVLGDSHKALLAQMRELRYVSNMGKPAERRLKDGATQMLREELDRLAVEHDYDPINPPIEKVIAE